MRLDTFFSAKSIVVVGVSREPLKVGSVVFRNLRERFGSRVFPVNPGVGEVLGVRCFASVLDIPEKVELGVIAVPGPVVPKVVAECGRKGIRYVVIISAGFGEVGNVKLEQELMSVLKKYNMLAIGPNCLGVLDAHSGVDTFFQPRERMARPVAGSVAFVAQSGAVCSTVLDVAVGAGHGFSKVVSYGNGVVVDESDLLEFLANDDETKVIGLYVEGVRDGRRFLKAASLAARKKPVIVLKGGLSAAGGRAALSHTGRLAGNAVIYECVFRQAGLVVVHSLSEFFDAVRAFERLKVKPKGSRVQVITNGGGFGILTADALGELPLLSKKTAVFLKKRLPVEATVANPLDLIGDATTERYAVAIDACLRDPFIDVLVVVVLFQVPLVGEDVVNVLVRAHESKKKPVFVVATGGEFSQKLIGRLDRAGVPVFMFPESAARAVRAVISYYIDQ